MPNQGKNGDPLFQDIYMEKETVVPTPQAPTPTIQLNLFWFMLLQSTQRVADQRRGEAASVCIGGGPGCFVSLLNRSS